MNTYNEKELNNLRHAGEILAATLMLVKKSLKAGMSTLDVDQLAEDYIIKAGGEPCFKHYKGYGFATCLSVNDEVIHGMPRADLILKNGDIISVDVGVRWGGFCTDAARTYGVGKINTNAQRLIDVTEQCFFVAVKGLCAEVQVGEIGRKIEHYIRTNTDYGILTNYFGHGIGRNVHEDPLIPNFKPTKPMLKAVCRQRLPVNTAICIEPMITEGSPEVTTQKDGWTVVTADGKLSAHYENTVIIHADRVEIITLGSEEKR